MKRELTLLRSFQRDLSALEQASRVCGVFNVFFICLIHNYSGLDAEFLIIY